MSKLERTRTRIVDSIQAPTHKWYAPSTGVVDSWPPDLVQEVLQTSDTIGDYPVPHGFSSVNERLSGMRLTTSVTENTDLTGGTMWHRWFEDPYSSRSIMRSHLFAIDEDDRPSPSTYLARILSQSGPITPDVNVPLALIELRDVPAMLKHAGDILHKLAGQKTFSKISKELAEAALAYDFGWAPLMSDLMKLVNFMEYVDKRRKLLDGTQTFLGARTRVNLGTYSNSATKEFDYGTQNATVLYSPESCTAQISLTRKRWATCVWRDAGFYALGDFQSPITPFRAALGLDPSYIPVTVWKALPWSWLVDWFINISQYIQAQQNLAYFTARDVCVMTHTKGTVSFPGLAVRASYPNVWLGAQGARFSPGKYTYENKARTVLAPGVIDEFNDYLSYQPKLPILDNFKLTVLSSLAVLRFGGRLPI